MPQLITCPECQRQLRVPDHLIGRAVKCPSCGAQFAAGAGSESPAAEEKPTQPARRRESEEEFSERPRSRPRDDEDFEERPRRRSRDDSDESDFDDYEDDRRRRRSRRRKAAEAAVMGPWIALLIVGGLGVLMGLLNVVLVVTTPPPPQHQNDAAFKVGRVIGASVSLIWGCVITFGAINLKSLRSYGSVMTAAIVALLPCNPCCLLGLPFGIWALVVLNNSDVKAAFR